MGHIIGRYLLIGPYKIRREGQDDPLILKYLTIVDPANVWFEMV